MALRKNLPVAACVLCYSGLWKSSPKPYIYIYIYIYSADPLRKKISKITLANWAPPAIYICSADPPPRTCF